MHLPALVYAGRQGLSAIDEAILGSTLGGADRRFAPATIYTSVSEQVGFGEPLGFGLGSKWQALDIRTSRFLFPFAPRVSVATADVEWQYFNRRSPDWRSLQRFVRFSRRAGFRHEALPLADHAYDFEALDRCH